MSPVEANHDEQEASAQDAQQEVAWTWFVQASEEKIAGGAYCSL